MSNSDNKKATQVSELSVCQIVQMAKKVGISQSRISSHLSRGKKGIDQLTLLILDSRQEEN